MKRVFNQVMAFFALVPVVLTGCAEKELLLRGPYPQVTTEESAILVWRTSTATEPVVRYGLAPDALFNSVSGEAINVRGPEKNPLAGAGRDVHQFEAQLVDLEPGQTYFYAIHHGNQRLAGGDAGHFFRTAPRAGKTDRVGIWVLGDSGTGGSDARAVYEGMKKYVQEKAFGIDLFLHVGDMAYWDGTDREFQRNFFDIYQETLKQVPCWPAFGNHEGHSASGAQGTGPYFDAYVLPTQGEAGGFASGNESVYSFDYGPIHFISLNSYDLSRAKDGQMATWLRQDLRTTRQEWVIAFLHHAPYTKGTHNSDAELPHIEVRENLMPILEEGGVDMVFAGHSHLYERSMLMDGAYETPTVAANVIYQDGDGDPDGDGPYRKSAGRKPNQGTLAVVVGNGGATMYQQGRMPIMRKAILEFGSLLLEWKGDEIVGRMIGTEGQVLDQFALQKKGRVKQTRLEHPWQPLGPDVMPMVPSFVNEVSVELVGLTKWPNEEIRYTLDGSEPNSESLLYEGPFTLTGDTTIKARTIDVARGKESPVSSRAFTLYTEGLLPPHEEVAGLQPGVAFSFYEGAWTRIPDYDQLEAVSEGVQPVPTLEQKPQPDDFGARFTGFIQVPVSGVYGFYLVSDDGSRLKIGDRTVVDHDGLHATKEKVGYVGLEAGLHPFELDYFERLEAETLALLIAGPGIPKQFVPGGAYFHLPE